MGNTYSSLKSRYGGFMVPVMEILVDGTDLLKGLSLNIKEVNVKLSLKEEDCATFSILDCYDIVSHSISSSVKGKLKPGAKVEIKMGYGSDKSTVFLGFIAEAGLTFEEQEGYVFRVTAVDVVRLLKEIRHRRTFSSDTYAEAYKEVMKGYSGLCKVKADSMDMELTEALYQDGTDYDFITEELIGNGAPSWELIITAGTAYMTDGSSEPESVLELKPGYGLVYFQWKNSYVNRKIKALGYLPGEGLASASAAAVCKNVASSGVKTEETVLMSGAVSKSQVTEKANARKKSLESESVTGILHTAGVPQLIPGKQITLSDVDDTIDGNYRIMEAEHVFNEEGYSAKVTVGG